MAATMKAAVFVEPGRILLDEKPIPDVGPLDALIRITTTTICGTDIHILKGEYPVARGLTIGHEPVGIIERLGSAVQGYGEGQRVIARAITPSGHSSACLCGCWSQDEARLQGLRRLAVREHHRWSANGTPPRPRRHDEPRSRSRGSERRAGAHVPRYHVHGLLRRGAGRREDR
ncbi:Zn-dependent alcohol dehydrogenase [Microvirga lotononidis]|uniref:Zn-dependent alcohol dehydrogenase n=1 Tax=Microvirga lotononidis TaxID=864069 RepID=I4YN27_9HYPH|nr:Zn-dependent alcohol dehydrogenase [Microvirga lotononidis]